MFSANSDSPEEDDDEDDGYSPTLSPGNAAAAARAMHDDDTGDDDFPYEVLTADELVRHMVDCIRQVNTVVQVYHRYSFTCTVGYKDAELWICQHSEKN